MEKNIVCKAKLKEIFKKRGFRINNQNLKKLSLLMSEQIGYLTEKIIRQVRISGRKTIKFEDIKSVVGQSF